MKFKLVYIITFAVFLFQFQGSAQSDLCKCCSSEFRQFDFWIGDWDVTSNGKAAGTNSIQTAQDSCLLVESWTSASPGYKGTSYNYYDSSTKFWYQTWVDNQGSSLRLKGAMLNGIMTLIDEPSFDQKGRLVTNKISWTPNNDGSVTQLWQVSYDAGITWNAAFNGLYTPKERNNTN